jgi:hypothetical protein
MDALMANALAKELDYIERIDRLTAVAERSSAKHCDGAYRRSSTASSK